MQQVTFENGPDFGQHILCLGAHSDDIEIGCGGTLIKLIKANPAMKVTWVVFSAVGPRRAEALNSAESYLSSIENKQIVIKQFRDGFFPYTGVEIKEYFEELKRTLQPDVVFTHYRDDRHQDHRVISDLTWNTFRNHLILEYEIPKYDGDFGTPNFFVHLDKEIRHQKIAKLTQYFGTQANKNWFTDDSFLAILRLRGIESGAPEGYAEAFYCRKIVFGI